MTSGFATHCRRLLRLAVLTVCLAGPYVRAEAPAPFSADAVKAAYLVNFIKFTDWKSSLPSAENAPIVIGVAGNRELEDYLWKITDGKLLLGRKVRVRRLSAPADAVDCQLVYIQPAPHTDTSPFAAEDWLKITRGRPMLAVSEDDGFLQKGGVINFYAENKNLRFEISPRAAEAAGLQLSSRLLSIARVVKIDAPATATP